MQNQGRNNRPLWIVWRWGPYWSSKNLATKALLVTCSTTPAPSERAFQWILCIGSEEAQLRPSSPEHGLRHRQKNKTKQNPLQWAALGRLMPGLESKAKMRTFTWAVGSLPAVSWVTWGCHSIFLSFRFISATGVATVSFPSLQVLCLHVRISAHSVRCLPSHL